MSILTGKCDLYDHISMEKMYPRDGNPNVLVSDIMECFNIFKEKTGGVIYQHKKVKVNTFNQKMIEKYCSYFKVIEHKETREDKRKKSGTKEIITYTYIYWNKEYTLKEINKKGVWISVPIKFNTLLELLPYFGYIVSSMCCSNGKEVVHITNENYALIRQGEALEYGNDSAFVIVDDYNEMLAHLYQDVVNKYFCPIGKEKLEEIIFDENGFGHTSSPIDTNFKISWVTEKSHWTAPEVVDATKGIIKMSKEDLQSYLGNTCDVYYVAKGEDVLYL